MLRDGLRQDGKSIVECCLDFGITDATYYAWIKEHPDFAEAAELGQMQCAAWHHRNHRAISSGEKAGNAATANFGMKNVDKVRWVDKTEVAHTHDEQISIIRIEMLPPRNDTRIIEHDEGNKSLPNTIPG